MPTSDPTWDETAPIEPSWDETTPTDRMQERKSLADEMSKLRFQGFLGEQEQAALGAAENIAKVAAIPATPILKLPRSQDPGVTGGLLNVVAGLAEGLSAPAYWMLPGSKPLQALTAGQIAGNIPQSTVNAVQTLTNPQATTAQKVEAGAAPVLEAGTAGLLSGAIRLPGRAAETTIPEPLPKAPVALNPEEREFQLLHENWLPTINPWRQEMLKEQVGRGEGTDTLELNMEDSPGARDVARAKRYYELARKLYSRTGEEVSPSEPAPKLPKEETPPVVPQGETPAEAPAVSEAVQEGVTAPPEEPAITETTVTPQITQAPAPPVHQTVKEAWQAYDEEGTLETPRDLANVIEGLHGEGKVPAYVMRALDRYKKAVEEDFTEYAGRGDVEPHEERFLNAVEKAAAAKPRKAKAPSPTPPEEVPYEPRGPETTSEYETKSVPVQSDFFENNIAASYWGGKPNPVKTFTHEGKNYVTQGIHWAGQKGASATGWELIPASDYKGETFTQKQIFEKFDKEERQRGDDTGLKVKLRGKDYVLGKPIHFYAAKEPVVAKPISEGPGAASPGDIPEGSQLSQLTQTIQRQISPAEPLIDRIKSAVNVADKWAKTKDSATQGIAKARAASQALIHGYLNLPPWRDFDESVGKWTGADQETALQVRQFQKQIVKAIPSRLRQEAITNWIQADGDEAVLRARAEASKPSVRRGYELALQLNEGEKTLARNVSQYLDARLKEGLANGLLKQGVDNYVTQIWKRPTSATQKLWADLFGTGALNPNFKYARRRIFDSYFEGEQAGYLPKNKTIGNLISQYDLAFNRALSARALIKQLQEGKAGDGMPITMTSGKTTPVGNAEEIPEAYLIKPNQPPTGAVSGDGRPYRPIDHWALRDWKWATKGPQGQNVFVQGDMLVHPDYYTRLNNALKTSRLRQPEGIGLVTGPVLKGAAILKQTKLSLSPFHTVQEGVHAMAHRVNPFAPAEIDLADPIQKGLVDHGLMVQDPRAHELFAEGSSGGGLIGKIPGLGRLQEAYTDLTFRDYIPKLKMEMAKDAFDRNMKAYSKQLASGKVTPDQIMALTARESNAAFGEQNYKMMGRSPTLQDVWRLTLLAPDFLESRFRFVAQALKPYGREQRIALGLMFATLYTAARVINKAADDNYHWDKPFSVFINGREYRLRTVLGDVQHLITDQRSFWYNRLSPVSRTVTEYLFSRDDRGIKRSSAEQFVDFLSWFKPIPTQIRSDQTLGQAALAATGIPSKSYTKAQQVYELVDNWMKNSKDPKVQERYQRLRQETLPDSPYRPLRDALKRDDLKAAKQEYLKLRQSRNDSIISEAMRQNRPFTGSLQSENKFKASLTEEQKRLYDQAIQERKDTYQKFLRAKGLK